MLDQLEEMGIARAVSAQLTERGSFGEDDCVMLIGSSVADFGHSRSDLDLLVSGGEEGRLPLHMFHEGRRVDVDFLDPAAWNDTKSRVNACAVSLAQPAGGELLAPVDDRDWWADHLWLYDRVVHGVAVTDGANTGFLDGSSPEQLSAAIGNYSRALSARMARRALMHRAVGNIEAACQYESEALLAAAEAIAAERGITFWSDRTVLEKVRRAQRPGDAWDAWHLELLFRDLVRRAWGSGPDRGDEVVEALAALLGPEIGTELGAADPAFGMRLVPGWKASTASGEGFLLSPDGSLFAVSPSVARFLQDGGDVPSLRWAVAAVLAGTGAVVLEPDGPVRLRVVPGGEPVPLLDACPTPVAPSPGSWLSSRITAQWNAMTVWSLSDDLHGAVESGHRNRVMPILRKAELFLRMTAVGLTGVRSDVSRNMVMDLQGGSANDGFAELADLVYSPDPAAFATVPTRAVELFSLAMADCGLPARSDMFEKHRSFMKQLGDVRRWFRISGDLDVAVQVPGTLAAKGGSSSSTGGSSVFLDPS